MRIGFYLAIVAAVVVAAYFRIGVVKEQRAAKVVTIQTEWEQKGVPVEVYTAESKDMVSSTRIAGVVKSARVISGQISRAVKGELRIGQVARVQVGDNEVQGRVTRLSQGSDSLTGLFTVEVSVNENLSAKKGESLTMQIETKRFAKRLIVPANAIIETDGVPSVVVVNNNDAEPRKIKTGLSSGDWVEVTQGLSIGEVIVVRGHSKIEAGKKVQVVSNTLNEVKND